MNTELFTKVADLIEEHPNWFLAGWPNMFIHAHGRMIQVPPSKEAPCSVIAIAIHLSGGFPEDEKPPSHSHFSIYRHDHTLCGRFGISHSEYDELNRSSWPKRWFEMAGRERPFYRDGRNHNFERPSAEDAVAILRKMIRNGNVDTCLQNEPDIEDIAEYEGE